jgi:hypothetical protein
VFGTLFGRQGGICGNVVKQAKFISLLDSSMFAVSTKNFTRPPNGRRVRRRVQNVLATIVAIKINYFKSSFTFGSLLGCARDFTAIEPDEIGTKSDFYKEMDFASSLVYASCIEIRTNPPCQKGAKDHAMADEFSSSTVTDTEFDIVEELKATAADLEKETTPSGNNKTSEKLSYLKFLINELDDTLSGEFEALRRKRFITKKTG